MSKRSNIHVALLRGINVGGRNKLPMKNLVSMFEGAGCAAVRSYIQSGNVIFEATPALARTLPELIGGEISRQFGFDCPIILRTANELGRVVRSNPFPREDTDDKSLCVAFLAAKPGKQRIAALDPQRSPGDEYVVSGREIYLRLPNGARSKLTNAYFDSKLDTTSTFRNWKTTHAMPSP